MSDFVAAGPFGPKEWTDDLYGPIGLKGGGSFRGKKFYVRTTTTKVGRRVIIHEFPGKDKAAAEDMGKSARRFRFDAYVLGPNYMKDRDALVKEFETAGPGQLVHPFWGKFTVTIEGDVDVEESYDFGGMAKFPINAVEAGVLAQPEVTADTKGAVLIASSGLLASVCAAFSTAFAVAGFISDVSQAAANVVNGVTGTITSLKGRIDSVMLAVDSVGDAIKQFSDGVSSLILLPGQLANQLSGIITSVVDSVKNLGTAWDSYFAPGESPGTTPGSPSLAPTSASPATAAVRTNLLLSVSDTMGSFTGGLVHGPDTTPARQQINSNQDALALLVQVSTAAAVCNVAADLPYASAESALSMRDRLISQLDSLSLVIADDASYASLCALRSAVYAHLSQAATSLPRIVVYMPPETVPALVLAQRLYGDSSMAQDIIDRNNVTDPSAIPGGQPLEVLSVG
jgi:prophage DNA circulation protein